MNNCDKYIDRVYTKPYNKVMENKIGKVSYRKIGRKVILPPL